MFTLTLCNFSWNGGWGMEKSGFQRTNALISVTGQGRTSWHLNCCQVSHVAMVRDLTLIPFQDGKPIVWDVLPTSLAEWYMDTLPSDRVWWPSKLPTVNCLNTPSLLLIISFSQLWSKTLFSLIYLHQAFYAQQHNML